MRLTEFFPPGVPNPLRGAVVSRAGGSVVIHLDQPIVVDGQVVSDVWTSDRYVQKEGPSSTIDDLLDRRDEKAVVYLYAEDPRLGRLVAWVVARLE